ncbi:MAG: hypothetical protein HY273_04910 [Gammaproteobacteria bacterium]|nr:hypothetical protein [Gammaproteobacteria bacterium]
MTRNKLTIFTLMLAIFGVVGCAQTKLGTIATTAAILEKDNSQIALALNKDGSITVVGVGAGERIKPCEIPGSDGGIPDEKTLAQCFPDGHVPGKILFQQNYTIGVREGSMCIYIWNSGSLYVFCNPPNNFSYSGH